jgi:hypothetical protein
MDGNERFVSGASMHPHQDFERIKNISAHQKPSAAILGCAGKRKVTFPRGLRMACTLRVPRSAQTRASPPRLCSTRAVATSSCAGEPHAHTQPSDTQRHGWAAAVHCKLAASLLVTCPPAALGSSSQRGGQHRDERGGCVARVRRARPGRQGGSPLVGVLPCRGGQVASGSD